jgi:hypothetical protein
MEQSAFLGTLAKLVDYYCADYAVRVGTAPSMRR